MAISKAGIASAARGGGQWRHVSGSSLWPESPEQLMIVASITRVAMAALPSVV